MSELFLNNTGSASVLSGVRRLIVKNGRLDMAVSYLQKSGWHSIKEFVRRLAADNIRLLVTDQLDLTHPKALELARRAGVQLRCYVGDRVYHPKVFLSRSEAGEPLAAIVGSSNLSDSGLRDGVEGALYVDESPVLPVISDWFDGLWNGRENSIEVDDEFIRRYRVRWRPAARARIKMRRFRRRRTREQPDVSGHLEDIEVLEDVCETIQVPLAILSIDQAGNNVRNLARLLRVLHAFPQIEPKPRSELRLLGLLDGDDLTVAGRRARKCKTERGLARVWCRWLKNSSDAQLDPINPNLAAFSRAATTFWRLRREVREFFLENLAVRNQRPLLMAIELLCNAGEAVRELKIEDFTALAPILMTPTSLPAHLRAAIEAYHNNKGSRSWTGDDRRILLEAWRDIQ